MCAQNGVEADRAFEITPETTAVFLSTSCTDHGVLRDAYLCDVPILPPKDLQRLIQRTPIQTILREHQDLNTRLAFVRERFQEPWTPAVLNDLFQTLLTTPLDHTPITADYINEQLNTPFPYIDQYPKPHTPPHHLTASQPPFLPHPTKRVEIHVPTSWLNPDVYTQNPHLLSLARTLRTPKGETEILLHTPHLHTLHLDRPLLRPTALNNLTHIPNLHTLHISSASLLTHTCVHTPPAPLCTPNVVSLDFAPHVPDQDAHDLTLHLHRLGLFSHTHHLSLPSTNTALNTSILSDCNLLPQLHTLSTQHAHDQQHLLRTLTDAAPHTSPLTKLSLSFDARSHNDLSLFTRLDIIRNLHDLRIRCATPFHININTHRRDPFPNLHTLILANVDLRRTSIPIFDTSTPTPFPNVEHFALQNSDPSPRALLRLLSSHLFPNLKTLNLSSSRLRPKHIKALAQSPLLPQLHTLNLSNTGLRTNAILDLFRNANLRNLRLLIRTGCGHSTNFTHAHNIIPNSVTIH